MEWARNGQRLAIDTVYATPENTDPLPDYIAKGKKVCERQVAIAGLRLAALLNRLLG
jgi:hypothetical protein